MKPSSVGKVIRSWVGRTGLLDKHITQAVGYRVYVNNYVRINEAHRLIRDAVDEALDAKMYE